MEGSHGQLGTGLTDRLCSDNTDCFTYLYSFTGCHVGTVTFCTDTNVRTAGQDRTDLHFLNRLTLCIYTYAEDLSCTAGGDHVVVFNDHVTVFIINILTGISACDSVFQTFNGLFTIHECLDYHTGDLCLTLAAVYFTDRKLLRYINHSSGQITGVCGTQRGIGHTLTCTMRGHEVFQYVQTFTEV